jgi:RNA polymerase sigma-54 factor
MRRIIEAVKYISELDPKPGRPFYETSEQYVTPDIYVYKVGEEFIIVLNEDGLPRLRISQTYKSLLSKQSSTLNERDYINDKLKSAMWLIRSIHQRQRTIYRVAESIVKFQRDFFDKGINYLKPMILKEVADDIDMHESTISRVTANKYIHTPQGIFELKFFFNSGIRKIEGKNVASETVKEKIKEIIASENIRKPYSDQEILAFLNEGNINIARRTIAKYREMLGYLPSSKRKKLI